MAKFTRPRLYAHRGAAAEQPENTIPSFQCAIDVGADALEMDLHLSQDGHVIVSHDPNALRMTGINRLLRETTWAEIATWDAGFGFQDREGNRPFAGKGYKIPTFEEVLTTFPKIVLNIDLKQNSPNMIHAVLKVIHRHRASERIILASFHVRTLLDVRRSPYQGATAVAPSELLLLLGCPQSIFRLLPWTGNAVQIPRRIGPIALDRPKFINKCHELGLRVDFWTINDPVQARVLLEKGADGIMTDNPRAVFPVIQAWSGLEE